MWARSGSQQNLIPQSSIVDSYKSGEATMTTSTATKSVPFHAPSIGEEAIRAVTETLESGWITTGPKTRSFEEAFARFIGVRHALTVSSCTAALHLSLNAAHITEDDELLVPTL